MMVVPDWRLSAHGSLILIITDLSMPGYTGLELCERIRQLSDVPVLVLSVKEDEPTKVKAFDLGADD